MGNREAMQPRKLYRAEADTVLLVAGSKNQPQARGWGDSVGVNRAWRAYEGSTCIPGRSGRFHKVVRGIEVL